MRSIFLMLWSFLSFLTQAQYLRYHQNETLEYEEVLEVYRELGDRHANTCLLEMGPTDSGRNLHLFLISSETIADEPDITELARGKAVILINNGIHAGEPCGIDASIEFASELLKGKVGDNVLVAIIPVYNIGGALNRNSHTRANQSGPEEYGFRGNARNLDLNRDFIKADALNTFSFYALFHALKPHIFIDTHTSNGADYQYTMTLISTQKDKLNPVLAGFLQNELEPFLYRGMKKKGWEMIPYVNVFGYTPDKGFAGFPDSPRYATGYTALFNTIGFVTEAHMLKPYADRVMATRIFLTTTYEFVLENSQKLVELKARADEEDQRRKSYGLRYGLDSSIVEKLVLKGYEYEYSRSAVTGGQRLRYLPSKPVNWEIDYYHTFKTIDSTSVPEFYVVPAAWREVPLRLQSNNVQMIPLLRDTVIEVTNFRIRDARFSPQPYEGHFPLLDFEVERITERSTFLKGDYLVPTNQVARRFIVSVLEPTATDSYLRWNFYDEIFQQKEHFSAYVFEDTAEELLRKNPELAGKFEAWKKENPETAKNPYAALDFIYKNSGYYEKSHLRYPIARIEY